MEDYEQHQPRSEALTDWEIYEKIPTLININILSSDQKSSLTILVKLIALARTLSKANFSYTKLLNSENTWSDDDIAVILNQKELTERMLEDMQESIASFLSSRAGILSPLLKAGKSLIEVQEREETRLRIQEWQKSRNFVVQNSGLANKQQKQDSALFAAMTDAFLQGLEHYINRHPSSALRIFQDSITRDLRQFLQGGAEREYKFTISLQNGQNAKYVSFNFEASVIEVTCGGSTHSPDYGMESYTSWFYSMWDDGSEENDGVFIESFDVIRELFCDVHVHFSIDSPDDMVFYSE